MRQPSVLVLIAAAASICAGSCQCPQSSKSSGDGGSGSDSGIGSDSGSVSDSGSLPDSGSTSDAGMTGPGDAGSQHIITGFCPGCPSFPGSTAPDGGLPPFGNLAGC
jgi:hypothetical protein